MATGRLSEWSDPIHPDAESQASASSCSDLRRYAGVVPAPESFRDEHFPECEFVFFWYPVDCEIAPISKKGHGGRRGSPGCQIKSFYDSWRAAVKNAGAGGFSSMT